MAGIQAYLTKPYIYLSVNPCKFIGIFSHRNFRLMSNAILKEIRGHLLLKTLTESTYRNFSVERPTRARMLAIIQKRTTMVGSAQPFFSK